MFVSGWFRQTSRDFCESLIDVDFDLEFIVVILQAMMAFAIMVWIKLVSQKNKQHPATRMDSFPCA